jgi:hypothetical protein
VLADGEGAADVGPVDAVQNIKVQFGDRRERHDAGRADDDVDAAEGLLDLGEGRFDGLLVGHVELDGQGFPALAGYLCHDLVGLGGVADVGDGHGVVLGGQPQCGLAADAAGPSGDQGDPCAWVGGHGSFLSAWCGNPCAAFLASPRW